MADNGKSAEESTVKIEDTEPAEETNEDKIFDIKINADDFPENSENDTAEVKTEESVVDETTEDQLPAVKEEAATSETNESDIITKQKIIESSPSSRKTTETHKQTSVSPTVSQNSTKSRKTYENRKNTTESLINSESSPELATTSNLNTSRYGRPRKPKITEDFYNIEDIFGPYERITSSSPRKKTQKLELSPNKAKESVNLENIKPIDLNSVLSINIPDDNAIEVSKVMKIVSNNSEFSPKSPSYSSKPVKTYGNKKKHNETKADSYDYIFLNGVQHDGEASDCSDSETNESLNKSELTNKTSYVPYKSVRLFSDESVNSNESLSESQIKKRTKKKLLKIKKKNKHSANNSTCSKSDILDDNAEKKSEKLAKKKKKLNKLQRDLNIGELKTGRLRSSIAESETDNETVKEVTKDDSDEAPGSPTYLPKVGQLAWSRVGSYPFWPSIVTTEPGTTRHSKTVILGRRSAKCFHVNFFGDNGRRSWVLSTHIFPFHRRSDLEVMAQSVSKDSKPKDPKHLSAFIINPNKLKKWENAVTEAEGITDCSCDIRIQKFFEMVSPKKKGKKRPFPSSKSPKMEMAHKKIKLEKRKYQKKIKTPKLLKSFVKDKKMKNKSDIKIKIEDENVSSSIKEEPTEKTKLKTPKNKKSDLLLDPDKNLEKKKSSKNSEDSKSEDSFSELDIPLAIKQEIRDTPSPLSQITSIQRHKRINLFRGISKERVCQICGKNQHVYKCKGSCFGLYHIECAKKIKLKTIISSNYSSEEETLKSEVIPPENFKHQEVTTIMDEILNNVFSKIEDATTKLKTEEPHSRKLSIAEQIDLKMQEVMQDLITETKYTDSTTDEGSENEDLFQTKISQPQSTSSDISQSESSKSEFQDFEETEKFNKVTRKIIKHVTADGIFDVIEEEETNNDYSSFKCPYCAKGVVPPCFICNKNWAKSGDENRHRCFTQQCGKYFHSECLKDWPQTKWTVSSKSKKIENETLSCPYHNCHTCISDDPRGPLSRYNNEKLAKCIRCPTTYHISNFCIPAGTEILSAYQIICPKHLHLKEEDDQSTRKSIEGVKKTSDVNKKFARVKIMQHVNASWCFICSMGGSLICCETCPSSFHVECLKLVPPEGRYLCEECESGRLPLYDEIVWVKLGAYRWWPAQILYPAEVPPNVACIPHTVGEFVVRFFGSHDHYWVNRGRVFLFQEGDTGHASSKKSAVDGLFVKAIEEATRAHKKFVEERTNRIAEARNGMKPPSYVKIKVNRPVGNVRSSDADTSNTTPCDCDPGWEEPCGTDSDCLNRILLTECNPMVCAAGSRCCNQFFEKRLYSPVAPFKTTGRGWGLKTLVPVKKGAFVIEYVGEVINEKEYRRRMKRKHEQKDENYYFLTIDKDRMIDAGPKGNVARFMNHSCSPNCETQKWTVNGDTRVGLFAITDISSGAELTFNYNLECIGEEKKECRCGAPNCSGFIGEKAKQDEVPKKRKSVPLKAKKKKSYAKLTEVITCFICGEADAIQPCDREACNKFYHLNCVSLENYQEGKWLCPSHSCNICSKRTTRCCYICINSYCPLHSDGNIRYDRIKGFVCTIHDLRLQRNNKGIKERKKIKEEIKEDTSMEDSTKTKEPNKTKKTKKQIRNSQSEIRMSTESKNTEEMAENNEENLHKDNEEPKKLKNSSRRSSKTSENQVLVEHIKEETEDSSSNQEDEEMKEKIITDEEIEKKDEEIKVMKPFKNGAVINESSNGESEIEANTSQNSTNEMLQIDIFVSCDDSSQNNNITQNIAIKKRKSRLSLKQTTDSSNSSQEDLSDDERPLVSLKKIKLQEDDKVEDKPLSERLEEIKVTVQKKKVKSNRSLSQSHLGNLQKHLKPANSDTKLTELKTIIKKPKRSLSLTDFDSSDSSDFVISRKIKKDKTLKKMKIITTELDKPKKLRSSILNNSSTQSEDEDKNKSVKTKEEVENTTPKNNLKKIKTPKTEEKSEKTKKPKLNSSKIETKHKNIKVNVAKTGISVRTTKKKESSHEERNKTTSASKTKKKFNLSLRKSDSSILIPNKIIKRRSNRNLKQEENTDDEDKHKSSINDESTISLIDPPREETKLKLSKKKKKLLHIGPRKLLRSNKLEESLDATIEEPTVDSNLQKEEQNDTKQENNEIVVKRKRGRPRKTPLPIETVERCETIDEQKTIEPPETVADVPPPQPEAPIVKRPKGRPRKQKPIVEEPKQNIEQVTELYKMKLNTESIPKNPYENHVNEVKLTANVPERHLRVVLRKHSEIDTKIDSKFLKMQNDIERDLPIRKRSKLRYEAQL